MKKDWVKLRKVKDGHSYWRRVTDGEIGICDNSGTFPEDCEPADDPPLLLDTRRPIALGERACMVPVKHENGRQSWTPASGFEGLWVATTFNMVLSAKERGGAEIHVRTASVETLEAP